MDCDVFVGSLLSTRVDACAPLNEDHKSHKMSCLIHISLIIFPFIASIKGDQYFAIYYTK